MNNVQDYLVKLYNELMEELEKRPEAKEEFFKNNKLFIGGCVFYKQDGFVKMFQKGSIVCNNKIGYGKQMIVVSFDENEIELEGVGYKDYLKDNIKVGYNDTFNMGTSDGLISIHPEFRERQLESERNPSFQDQLNKIFLESYKKH